MTAEVLIRELGLAPHPEGGFFRETHRAEALPFALPDRGVRSAATAIYFLLASGDFSAFHRIRSDEVWHHYAGSALEVHTLEPTRGHEVFVLGAAIERGERPQHVVPAGVFQAARVRGAGYALVGCTVAPGFDFADFEMPPRAELTASFPACAGIIAELTR
ncbi:MAG TPA: cupin domain-containing protein [Polyangiaceae bacterium]|nr:cupin domain-containing protein [Polyangiaceae bacterium]